MNAELYKAPSTVIVFTRHSPDCPKKKHRYWRRCKCRKWLYIFEGGKALRVSAGTRSWDEADRRAQAERDRRNPVKRKLQEIGELEDQKAALTKSKNITVKEATERWLKSQKSGSSAETVMIYDRAARRIDTWAADQVGSWPLGSLGQPRCTAGKPAGRAQAENTAKRSIGGYTPATAKLTLKSLDQSTRNYTTNEA